MNEFELRFQVPPDRLAALERAVRRGTTRRQRLRAIYYDTAGGALAAQGIVLRLRQEGRTWVQTAKAAGDGGFDRIEDNVTLAAPEQPEPDIALHRGTATGKRIAKALEQAEDKTLREVFRTDIVRLSRNINAAGTLVEIALDRGTIHGGGRKSAVRELEIERKEGSTRATVELARRWSETHGLWLDPVTKSMVGQRLARGEPAAAAGAQPLAATGKLEASQLLAAMLDGALEQALLNAREVALGSGTDEHVHQMRVGLRRLRTVVREVQGVASFADPEEPVEAALADTFRVLGRHRDLTQLVPAVQQQLARAGGPTFAWDAELPDVAAAARAPALEAALLSLIATSTRLREEPGPTLTLKALRQHVAKRLRKLYRRVAADGARFEQLEPAERHRVRKRLKRLRYLSELARPLYRAAKVDVFVAALKTLQDALGEYQDAVAGRALWEERAQVQAEAWFGAGWLAAREERLARKCERACRKTLPHARRFWDD